MELFTRIFRRLGYLNSKFFAPLEYTGNDEHRGWGEKYDWYTLGEAFQIAKKERKNVMIIIHRMSCTACWYTKNWFSRSAAILSLSKNFVMVNLEASAVPRDEQYSPDGNYVPRILFFNPQGRLMPHVKFTYAQVYMYNYPDEGELVRNMKLLSEK